jgi:ABC-2 type transport system permease protein
MFERIKHLAIKEFIETFRLKRRVFFILVPPFLQLLVFGYVATLDVNNVPTVWLDADKSQESRELARRIEASGYFSIVARPASSKEIAPLVDKGEAIVAIEVDRQFSKNIRKGMPGRIQVIVDGTDSNTALIAMNYVTLIAARYATDLGTPLAVDGPRPDFRTRVWYNPDLRSRNYFLPGVIALIIMLTCLMLTSMAVVRERETGTMEQLMVTPITPLELMIGKTLTPTFIGFVDMLMITVGGVLWFDVPIKGSIFFLFIATGVYVLSLLGIGLFISTISKSQQQAMLASFFFFQPAILLSGFVTTIESMPAVFQYVTYLSPLRYYLVIVRGVFLKGVGWEVLWGQVLALLALGVAIFLLSALRFKKRLA